MKIKHSKRSLITTALLVVLYSTQAWSAVTLDRTRIIFNSDQKNVALTITNKNTQLPYLAQGWIENDQEQKVSSPFAVLPPVQRLEPGKSSQLRIDALPAVAQLPQDRESLFYFNLREIPPKSDKPNVLQLALQSKIKLFYRPQNIVIDDTEKMNHPWQEKLILLKQGNQYIAKNPTPFYVTIIGASATDNESMKKAFDAVMVAPFSEKSLGVSSAELGNSPILTYINDYGGRLNLYFKCVANQCVVAPDKKS
ncbi:fimbria/pilus periplasmic chaperone [Moellerella wisconsensis]|uniref:fimbria/pilus periplasmic chaperone n=1 Tax=Moellerella wisconsensis TaxID=158849 RepID=UPI00240F90C0|nr:fimbria/pilus periplasmic chaperone [Moellerella wisconsensis]